MLRLTSLGGNENLPRPFNGYLLEKLARLLSAMTVVECGILIGEVDTDAIWEGYDLAFPGKRITRAGRIRSTEPLMLTPYTLPDEYQHSTLSLDDDFESAY